MKKNFFFFILILLLIPTFVVSIIFKSLKNETESTKISDIKITTVIQNKTTNVSVNIYKDDIMKNIDLEDYIIGVVAGEMPASFEVEALKAQAIASRTYAMYQIENNKDLKTSTSDQVYITVDEMKNKWGPDFDLYYKKVRNAVKSTEGLIMKQESKLFKAFYFAMSNGYTEDSSLVFGESNLESVSSPWDNESLNKFIVSTTFTKESLESLLNVNNIYSVEIKSRDKTNRVSKIVVNDKEFTGIEFRQLLTLRSTDFTITKDNENYIITTKGYGHGVGMSQYGANGMAKEKYTYDEILKYYYKNIEITKI